MLIENGVLTDYMWDVVRSRAEGRPSSGNGRRETYQHLPMVRMTNTYLMPGDDGSRRHHRQTPSTASYCVALGGGQVNTATGDFVFGVTEAYLIENGEITEPVRAAQLIGNGSETLRMVDAVGNDFDTWAGTCGKQGQGVPVSSGQPTLRVARAHRGRHRCVSDRASPSRAAWPRARSRASKSRPTSRGSHDTDIKVFAGKVEELAVAESGGVGVRVIVDGRLGYAWAGSLDPDVVARRDRRSARQRTLRGAGRVERICRRRPTPARSSRRRPRPLA